jgi:hypothetical protein
MASTYRRFRDLEHQITVLTRRLALDEAVLPEQPVVQHTRTTDARRGEEAR